MAKAKEKPPSFYLLDEDGQIRESFDTLAMALSGDTDDMLDGYKIVQVVRRFQEPTEKGVWKTVS